MYNRTKGKHNLVQLSLPSPQIMLYRKVLYMVHMPLIFS